MNTPLKIAVIGDHITDVVFPAESRLPVNWAKEAAYTNTFEEQLQISGLGGLQYLQQIFRLLFQTHCSPAFGPLSSNELVSYQAHDPDPKKAFVTFWTVEKRPREIGSNEPKTYRVIEKNGTFSPSQDPKNPLTDAALPPFAAFPASGPELLLVADYGRRTRVRPEWNGEYRSWLTSGCLDTKAPRRIVLLGNRLPKAAHGKLGEESMWDILFREDADPNSTIVVTGIDRLRQEGARISKRISWDSTLLDVRRELNEFPPLRRLALKCQLVIRIGVVGAIHTYPIDGKRLEMRFLYDPKPKQDGFRNRTLQGNAFGIRAVIPACIAFHLFLKSQRPKLSQRPARLHETDPTVSLGIQDGISILQNIYTTGFGTSKSEVRDFICNTNNLRMDALSSSLTRAKKVLDETDSIPIHSKWFIHILRPATVPCDLHNPSRFREWTVLRDNLRTMIKPDEILLEFEKGGGSAEIALSMLNDLEELRCLRMARAITLLGTERALNNARVPASLVRPHGVSRSAYLQEIFEQESRLDKRFRMRMIGEIGTDDVVSMVNPEAAFPLNSPIGRFGRMKVMGKTDIENLSSVRNLLSAHLSERRVRPLCLAAFGKPGSGKSFGIKEVALTLAADSLEVYECNLSHLTNREELNREFFNAFQIILKNKTPLVIFDEFDSTKDREPLGWLKHFLEPMNDGKFRHTHGVGELRNAIFVFAGGTKHTYHQFSKQPGLEEAKVPDFISRLHSVIDVPGLDEETGFPGETPFIRRALLLRSLLEESGDLLSDDGVAKVDRNIVDAFLRVEKYSHGARSMRSVFGMFIRWNMSVQKVSVPTEEQLNLHTNGSDFLELIYQPEARMPLPRRSETKGVTT